MSTELAIEVRGVSISYPSRANVLTDVSFCLPRGSGIGLMGRNGAGKSTLVKALCGTLQPDRGSISVLGSTNIYHSIETKLRVGVVHQRMTFDMMLTVRDNLRNAASLRGVRWSSVARSLDSLMDEVGVPEEQLSRTVFTLSGGEMRRVQLIRALMLNPEVLIVDEPTTGLDIEARSALLDILAQRMAEGMSMVLCSHYGREVQKACSSILCIKDGRVAYEGTLCGFSALSESRDIEEAFVKLVGEGD